MILSSVELSLSNKKNYMLLIVSSKHETNGSSRIRITIDFLRNMNNQIIHVKSNRYTIQPFSSYLQRNNLIVAKRFHYVVESDTIQRLSHLYSLTCSTTVIASESSANKALSAPKK